MFCYRWLWESLAQTGGKPGQRLIIIVYNYILQALTSVKKQAKTISFLIACLGFPKNICLATNNLHSFSTNKIIFRLGKNNFIRLPALCIVAGMEAGTV